MAQGVFLPPETWAHILSYCERDWNAREYSRRPGSDEGCSVVAFFEQRAAACVCKAWACGISPLRKRLHLRVSCVDEDAKDKLIQIVALSMRNPLVPFFTPGMGARITAAVSSVRQGKNLVRTCVSSVLRKMVIFSGNGGPGSPGVALTGELQEIAKKMPPKSSILVDHMAWPPLGDNLVSLPYCNVASGNRKEDVWKIVLRRIRLYGPNVWDRIQKKIPKYSPSISLTEVLNISLGSLHQTLRCACLEPISVPYWDIKPFKVGRLTYYVPSCTHQRESERTLCMLPKVNTVVTITAGSSYASKARFTKNCRFQAISRAHLPPGYMLFEDVRHIRLAHIEIRDFDVFRRVFPKVETVEIGTRVACQIHLEEFIRMTDGISLKV